MFLRLIKDFWAEKSVSGLAGLISLSFLLAFSGPFGTYEKLGITSRLLLWSGTVLTALATAAIAHELSGQVARRRQWTRLQREALRLVLVVLVFTPIAYLTVTTLGGSDTSLRAAGFLKSGVYVFAFALGLRLLNGALPPMGGPAKPKAEQGPAPENRAEPVRPVAEPRLIQRLPEGFQGPILRINSRDHFVEVVSAGETVSLRMRLADAISEMEPLEGIVPHRSHWVLKEAVTGNVRDGSRIELCLSNGDRVPVSRGARKKLEEDGVL